MDSALSDLEKAIPPATPSDPQLKAQFQADIKLLKKSFAVDIAAPAAQNPEGGDFYKLSKRFPHKLEEIAERLEHY